MRIIIYVLLGALCSFALPLTAQNELQVQSISVLGAYKTKIPVIMRELTFTQGDTLNNEELEAVLLRNRQNIYNLGLFTDVNLKPIIHQGHLYVVIEVKERWYIFPSPQIITEERNNYDLIQALREGDFHRLAFGLGIEWRNVSGWNETLKFYGQLGFSKRLNVSFIRPGVFNDPYFDLVLSFNYRENKEIITDVESGIVQWNRVDDDFLQITYGASLGLRKRFSLYHSLFGSAGFIQANLNDSIYQYNSTYLTTDRGKEYYPNFLLAFENDQRDWRAFPLDGIKYQVLFRYAGFPGLSTTQFSKLGFTWAHHIPLSKRWNFAYGLHNVVTLGKKVPFFDKSSIGIGRRDLPGISTSLRGYQPYAISGSYVNMTKAEVKYAVLPRKTYHLKFIPIRQFQDILFSAYLTAFIDAGYVSDNTFNNQNQFLKDRLLTGYGVGLNVVWFYDRLVRIEVARNHMGETGIYLHGRLPIK